MTIALSANTPRISYTVNQGVTQTSFPVPFVFFTASTDLNVFVDNVERTFDASTSSTSLYTVSGGDGSTGTVTTSVTGITGGSTVVSPRSIPLQRVTDFPSGGAFEVAKLNTELDTLLTMITDIDDDSSRAIRLLDNDVTATLTLPLKADRVGKILGFNSSSGNAEAVNHITTAAVTVSTLSAGASATATVTQSGNTATFAFGIPTGATGATGAAGANGADGADGDMTSFNVAGTSGSPQTITNGNTLTIAAGSGITTTASSTDTVTVAVTADPIAFAIGLG